MCLRVFRWFQSKLNALSDTTSPREGERCSHRNCFPELVPPPSHRGQPTVRRRSRSKFLGHTLLMASQGLESCWKRSLFMTSKGRALGVLSFKPTHRTRGPVLVSSHRQRDPRLQLKGHSDSQKLLPQRHHVLVT